VRTARRRQRPSQEAPACPAGALVIGSDNQRVRYCAAAAARGPATRHTATAARRRADAGGQARAYEAPWRRSRFRHDPAGSRPGSPAPPVRIRAVVGGDRRADRGARRQRPDPELESAGMALELADWAGGVIGLLAAAWGPAPNRPRSSRQSAPARGRRNPGRGRRRLRRAGVRGRPADLGGDWRRPTTTAG
jgi:hypothetical protein